MDCKNEDAYRIEFKKIHRSFSSEIADGEAILERNGSSGVIKRVMKEINLAHENASQAAVCCPLQFCDAIHFAVFDRFPQRRYRFIVPAVLRLREQ